MNQAGKGDKPRKVNKEKYDEHYAQIFNSIKEETPLYKKLIGVMSLPTIVLLIAMGAFSALFLEKDIAVITSLIGVGLTGIFTTLNLLLGGKENKDPMLELCLKVIDALQKKNNVEIDNGTSFIKMGDDGVSTKTNEKENDDE